MGDRGLRNLTNLARRFKGAIDQEREAKRIAEEQAGLERQRLQAARVELMDALRAFGEAVDHFAVERREGWLEFRYEQRALRFEEAGERGKIRVSSEQLEGDHRIFHEEAMDRWIWSREDRYGREHREMLFETGLEKLVAAVFEVAPLDEAYVPSAPLEDGDPESEGDQPEAVPFPPKTL